MNRRDFIKVATASTAATALPRRILAADGKDEIRAVLMHLGHNMWCDWLPEGLMQPAFVPERFLPDLELKFDEAVWRRLTARMAERKINMAVIDLGEGMVYPSHPELAVKGSWPAARVTAEVRRLKAMGIEAIPKMNFSATHDGWLKDYGRMLTLPKWYEVVKDVLRDAYEAFDRPRFIHIGFDEEDTDHSGGRCYFVMRTGELWWRDFLHAVRCVEALGARPWVWSDFGWKHKEYFTRCPKSVVQSNWYYDESYGGFDPDRYAGTSQKERLLEFWELEKAGFDQIPCGTNWIGWKRRQLKIGADDVMGELVKLGRKVIAAERRLGFMMAPWCRCDVESEAKIAKAIDLLADAVGAPCGA